MYRFECVNKCAPRTDKHEHAFFRTVTHCNTLLHNATQCNTMQHNATHTLTGSMLESGPIPSSSWTYDPLILIFSLSYSFLVFLIMLNFIIAIVSLNSNHTSQCVVVWCKLSGVMRATYIHTYIHTHIHTNIHTCKHTHIQTYKQMYIHSNICVYDKVVEAYMKVKEGIESTHTEQEFLTDIVSVFIAGFAYVTVRSLYLLCFTASNLI